MPPLGLEFGMLFGEGSLTAEKLPSGLHPLRVVGVDADGKIAAEAMRALIGAATPTRRRVERDQNEALAAWPQPGLPGAQLGPNRNGRR